MRLNINGLCGCGFSLERQDDIATVTLRSHDTTVTRTLRDADVDGLEADVYDVIDFVRSVAVAIEFDEAEGCTRGNFCDDNFYAPGLALESRFDLVDDSNDHIRASFTLLSSDEDSLSFCHVGVVIDVSLRQLLDDAHAAADTDPQFSL